MQGTYLLCRPLVPVLQGLRRQPSSERMRVKLGAHRLPCLP